MLITVLPLFLSRITAYLPLRHAKKIVPALFLNDPVSNSDAKKDANTFVDPTLVRFNHQRHPGHHRNPNPKPYPEPGAGP